MTKIAYLEPDLKVSAIKKVCLAELWNKGIKGLIIDLDNTISPWRQDFVTCEADEFVKEALQQGFKVVFISNSSYLRTRIIAEIYSVSFVAPAYKPFSYAFSRALADMRLTSAEAAVIGDQIFTDVLGGNRAGCYTILVPPLSDKEFVWTRLMRRLEKIVRGD